VTRSLKALLLVSWLSSSGWGFFGHQQINRLAVFSLPPDMVGFYKKNIRYLIETSTHPDERRYAVAAEAPRHFIDLDVYRDSLPRRWSDAVARYGEDSLQKHGIVPWHVVAMFYRLREAFMLNDSERVLKISAELGHYVGDAHVPLHTTRNYNGQLTGQAGIHGLWESRLPELFFADYDFFIGPASYIDDPTAAIWNTISESHDAVDSVLRLERELAVEQATRFSYETKGKQTIRVYDPIFSRKYHELLSGMVERRLRASVKMTADLWFTAWVDAGQPDLRQWIRREPTPEELQLRAAELEVWKKVNFSRMEGDHHR
jgi:hypothetical protein